MSTSSGPKHDQKCGCAVIHGHLLTFGLDGQGLRENKFGRLIKQGLEKEVRGWTPQNGPCEDTCVLYKYSLKDI